MLGLQPHIKTISDVSALWGDKKGILCVIWYMLLSWEVSGLPEMTWFSIVLNSLACRWCGERCFTILLNGISC
jgi:hypothetical protein